MKAESFLLSVSGREALSELFEYKLELLSAGNLDLSGLLGRPAQLELVLADESVRFVSGIVSHFGLLGERGRYAHYEATLRPWLWLLGNTKNCRIFQQKSVPAVVEELFHEHHSTDFRSALTATYAPREYLVQYRESDLDFVSRILEEEGIYYFFEHQAGKHILVLADSRAAHVEATPGRALPYVPQEPDDVSKLSERVDAWSVSRRIVPARYAVSDFDFERRGSKPFTVSERRPQDGVGNAEVFDYPRAFASPEAAEGYALTRLEEAQLDYELARGGGELPGLKTGFIFTLSEHPRKEQNKSYLVLEARQELRVDTPATVELAQVEEHSRCEFVALDARRPFRPLSRTRKPVVEGPQTAVVVGPSNEGIWTDEYGRIKLKFHWDRFGESDQAASCWVRVAQIWAGSGFGGMHVPRIGQEVIVDFLEGDPDRPIVVGRVYNADNRPPYALPANQTQSGIKSRSMEGGAPENYNEIRFEDKIGSEELHFRAERDQTTTVKHDQSTDVGAKQTLSVGTEQTVTVGAAQTVTVGAAQTISVGAARSALIGAEDSTTVMGSRDVTVRGADTLTSLGPRTETFGAGRSVTVTSSDTTNVTGGDKTTLVEGSHAIGADAFAVDAKSGFSLACPSGSISAGAAAPGTGAGGPPSMLTLIATDALVLQCGDNAIFISKEGISISSTSSVAAFVGDNVMALSPEEATLAGKKTVVSADGETDVMGSKVNLRKAPPRKSLKRR